MATLLRTVEARFQGNSSVKREGHHIVFSPVWWSDVTIICIIMHQKKLKGGTSAKRSEEQGCPEQALAGKLFSFLPHSIFHPEIQLRFESMMPSPFTGRSPCARIEEEGNIVLFNVIPPGNHRYFSILSRTAVRPVV